MGFKVVEDKDIFIDNTAKLSALSYATLVINKPITLEEQHKLVEKMNTYLKAKRSTNIRLFFKILEYMTYMAGTDYHLNWVLLMMIKIHYSPMQKIRCGA